MPNDPSESRELTGLPGGPWQPIAEEAWHPLAAVQTGEVAGASPRVYLGPANRVGARYFLVYLQDAEGALSTHPILSGLHHTGPYPSHHWIEVGSTSWRVRFPGDGHKALELDGHGYAQLMGCLAWAIPPGGHLMVEYESPEHQETERLLVAGVPPVLTPLGHVLFTVGCGHGIRDWYIAEGWSEGPRKLQGYRALDDDQARRKEEELAREVLAYLEGHPPEDCGLRWRARDLLGRLRPLDAGTSDRIQRALAALGPWAPPPVPHAVRGLARPLTLVGRYAMLGVSDGWLQPPVSPP